MYTEKERLLIKCGLSAYLQELNKTYAKEEDENERTYLNERMGEVIALWHRI